MIRLDIGGGINPRDGFTSVDQLATADVQCQFEDMEPGSLPWTDDAVDEVYSSHCFEHIENYHGLLHEICRVCKAGSRVEIRVPHWASSMAHCAGHRHAIGEKQIAHWHEFPEAWWGESPKRLKLLETIRIPSENFSEAKGLFPKLTDDQIMRFVQDTCHEIRFVFTVEVAPDSPSAT